jgi:hypothetical protein
MKEIGTLLDALNATLYGGSRLPLMTPSLKPAPSAVRPIGVTKRLKKKARVAVYFKPLIAILLT